MVSTDGMNNFKKYKKIKIIRPIYGNIIWETDFMGETFDDVNDATRDSEVFRIKFIEQIRHINKEINTHDLIKIWNRLVNLIGCQLTFNEVTDFIKRMNKEERSQREDTKKELRRGESHSYRHDSG